LKEFQQPSCHKDLRECL